MLAHILKCYERFRAAAAICAQDAGGLDRPAVLARGARNPGFGAVGQSWRSAVRALSRRAREVRKRAIAAMRRIMRFLCRPTVVRNCLLRAYPRSRLIRPLSTAQIATCARERTPSLVSTCVTCVSAVRS